jgi:ankyrin repeat protein
MAMLMVWVTIGCQSASKPGTPQQLNEGLLAAVRAKQIADVRDLLARGAHPDLIDTSGEHSTTPLLVACENGDAEIARELLRAGANVNRREGGADFGNTPLMVAARFGHSEVVEVLLEGGANPFARFGPFQLESPAGAAGGGTSAIDQAVAYGHAETARLLLLAGAPPTPFHLYSAITNGSSQLVRLVLAAGVDPAQPFAWNGRTALQVAESTESPARAEILAVLQRTPSRQVQR